MRVLVVNTGSSSLKLRVLEPDDRAAEETHLDRWDGEDVQALVALAERHTVDVVGHRVVHGGSGPGPAAVVDAALEQRLAGLVPLAPLHQPPALAAIRAARAALPDVPGVACFDTGFHATLAPAAATYALPRPWRHRWGLRRFGFHGLSHSHAARRAAEMLDPDATDLRIVVAHLGAGASLCAVAGGRSVDTTMGFTPLEGLVMATRAGSVDPGLVMWLLTQAGLTAEEVDRGLQHDSGLAGLSGGSGDMRDVLAAAREGDDAARLALDVYVHRLCREIGAMAAALEGLDALVFTGGVGEHEPEIRAAAIARLGWLGLAIDGTANEVADGDTDLTASDASARTLVIEAREDLEIARLARETLAGAGHRP
jgi:acetate kinase